MGMVVYVLCLCCGCCVSVASRSGVRNFFSLRGRKNVGLPSAPPLNNNHALQAKHINKKLTLIP